MSRYRNNPAAIRSPISLDSIHHAIYLDPEFFDREMEHLWRNTWIYVGHDSLIPLNGNFYSTLIGREPIVHDSRD